MIGNVRNFYVMLGQVMPSKDRLAIISLGFARLSAYAMIVQVRTSYVMLGQINPGSFRLYQVRFLCHVSSCKFIFSNVRTIYFRLF